MTVVFAFMGSFFSVVSWSPRRGCLNDITP